MSLASSGAPELPAGQGKLRSLRARSEGRERQGHRLTSYIGNWDDVSAGREQALAQIGRSADVIFQNADAAGLGVFQAARETKKALVIGSNSNQNAVAPDITIASVVIDLPHAFLTVAREVKSKTFKPRLIRLGSESDVVTLVVNPAFQSRIPPAAMKVVDSVRRELAAGRFDPRAPPP